MPIQIDENRSDAYIGTFNLADESDEIKTLKRMVKNINAMLKADDFDMKFRVVLKGRLGKNNPNADKYKLRGSYQTISLRDSDHVDAYIYKV